MDYDNVCLVPRTISQIKSRDDIDISSHNSDIDLDVPIIASPMRDVCDGNIAHRIWELGGLGIIHRFCSIEEQVEYYMQEGHSFCAIGLNDENRFKALYDEGCKQFCIDVANGANIAVAQAIEYYLDMSEDHIIFIVGNIASVECFNWLEKQPNVVGIRVGIAGGDVCTTKNATGIYHPALSLIKECYEGRKTSTLIIADGGVRCPGDFCKAIAFGADAVMLGSLIAATAESPAELIRQGNSLFKLYHGSASFDIQSTYKVPKYIEGKSKLIPYEEDTLEALMIRFKDGLRSSMSYFNARNLNEYRRNISYKITR